MLMRIIKMRNKNMYIKKEYRKWFKGMICLFSLIFLAVVQVNLAQNTSSSNSQNENIVVQKILAEQNIGKKEILVTMKVSKINLADALEILAENIRVGISYNSEIMPKKKVSIDMNNAPVFDVLYKLLKGTNLEPVLPPSKDVLVIREKEVKNNLEVLQKTIRGTVTDASDGTPLPGVNITVQGMPSVGTTTNIDGEYSLDVPEGQNVLLFSFVGFVAQEIEINDREVIDVELQPDIQLLEDVVVVGYGTQERRQITGSVSSVKEEDFVRGNVNNAEELIQGKVAGLQIVTEGGNPNQRQTIRLRGISTVSSSGEPLIVVDGIIGASLENIDPNDIESIDVLKDASASAIYGTRGAAGVILITTKRAESGRIEANFNSSISVIGIENSLDVLNGDQFRELAEIMDIAILDFGANTDWEDEVSRTGTNAVTSLSLSGGNEKTSYRISGNFRDNNGIQRKTGFQQISGRLNLRQKALDDKLAVTFNLGSTNREINFGFNDVFKQAANMNPTAPVRSEGFEATGGFTEIGTQFILNPVAIIETGENVGERQTFNGAIRAEYEFRDLVPGLKASVFYSLEKINFSQETFFSKENKRSGGATQSGRGPGLAQRVATENKNELFELTVTYNKSLNKLNLETIAGSSLNDFNSGGFSASGGDFITDVVGANNLSFAQDFNQGEGNVGSFANFNRIFGFFQRVNLTWDDTYFLNGTFRREASSRFGRNQRWGNFWSIGGAIELTNFIEMKFINQLKLRSSFGVTGNDAPFDGISQLRFEPRGNFFVNNEFITSFGPGSNANPDLKWEENREFTIGTDFEVFNSRVRGSLEYYKKTTDDLLFNVQVPVPPNLFNRTWRNVGELENKGIEATLDVDVIQKNNLKWNSLFTFSTFDTELTEFFSDDAIFIANAGGPGQNGQLLVRVAKGEPIGQLWGPLFAGISEDGRWEFWENAEVGGNKIFQEDIGLEDETVLGSGLPDFSIGWTNTLDYKNWSLSTFIRGVFGHQLQNQFRLFFEVPNNINTFNVLESAFNFTDLTQDNVEASSIHVENADFVRLQNLNLTYNVPLSVNNPIRNLSFTLSGNNLFTITGYDGINPEVRFVDRGVGGGDSNVLAPGIERRNNWFTTRSVTFTANVGF